MPKRFIDPAPDRPVRFREWRAYRGMTQGQVEELLEWGASRLSKLESGTHTWTDEMLTALARVYACEVEQLFELPPTVPQPFTPAVREIARPGGIAGIVEMHQLMTRLQAEIADLKRPLFRGCRASRTAWPKLAQSRKARSRTPKNWRDYLPALPRNCRRQTAGAAPAKPQSEKFLLEPTPTTRHPLVCVERNPDLPGSADFLKNIIEENGDG